MKIRFPGIYLGLFLLLNTLAAGLIYKAYKDDGVRGRIKDSPLYEYLSPLAAPVYRVLSKVDEAFDGSVTGKYKMLVDKSDRTLYLFPKDTDLESLPENIDPDFLNAETYPVALGKPGNDNYTITPNGKFRVIGKRTKAEERSNGGEWKNGWGDCMLMLDIDFPHVNIHGTKNPGRIGRCVSDGCVEVVNSDAKELYENVSIGSKGLIRE
jgi:lipoprotein-anchoring transpeptidase ErfK/SrfK